jgi:hypothetical protein
VQAVLEKKEEKKEKVEEEKVEADIYFRVYYENIL